MMFHMNHLCLFLLQCKYRKLPQQNASAIHPTHHLKQSAYQNPKPNKGGGCGEQTVHPQVNATNSFSIQPTHHLKQSAYQNPKQNKGGGCGEQTVPRLI